MKLKKLQYKPLIFSHKIYIINGGIDGDGKTIFIVYLDTNKNKHCKCNLSKNKMRKKKNNYLND